MGAWQVLPCCGGQLAGPPPLPTGRRRCPRGAAAAHGAPPLPALARRSVLIEVPFKPPVRLAMATSGELQLLDATGVQLWSSGSKGAGRPPHVLQILDGSLLVADSMGATTWLANATCPAGTRLAAWAQCGGTACQAGLPCKDAQHPGSCCPTGWQCQRASAAQWKCMPTAALGRCTGSRSIPAGSPCGGTAACGADVMCSSSSCCAAGSVCQRLSSARWECRALPPQPKP
jgi:hypothetical protein